MHYCKLCRPSRETRPKLTHSRLSLVTLPYTLIRAFKFDTQQHPVISGEPIVLLWTKEQGDPDSFRLAIKQSPGNKFNGEFPQPVNTGGISTGQVGRFPAGPAG